MAIFDRYVRNAIISNAALVLLVVVGLDAFITFVSESQLVNRYEDYSYLQALGYLFLLSPEKLVEFLPAVVLIGSLLGMGALASNGELTAVRAAGMARWQIALSAMKTGALFGVLILLFYQYVTPYTHTQAIQLRAKTLGKTHLLTLDNFWSKQMIDARERFVHIGHSNAQGVLFDVSIIEFADNQLRSRQVIESAYYQNGSWVFENVRDYQYHDQRIDISQTQERRNIEFLPPDVYESAHVELDTLSIMDLYHYAQYLGNNGLDNYRYRQVLYKKITAPLSVLVMILLAMPFVFGHSRSGNTGARLVIGIIFGMCYYIFAEMMSSLGRVYLMPVWLSIFVPIVFFTVVGLVLIRRNTV